MAERYFSKQTFAFLSALAKHNERDWFEAHKNDYEDHVRTPALDFIADVALEMPSISPHFLALPKKLGGSLMRIFRDTRFSRDKTPYKTNIGIQFRHELGKDVHAPGYYLHIEPGNCFAAIGLWRPDPDALFKIRQAVAEKPDAWLAARDDHAFRDRFSLEGDSLTKVPRGFAKDHPLADDLRRKDFIGVAPFDDATAASGKLRAEVVERFRAAEPYMRFLCQAVDVRF